MRCSLQYGHVLASTAYSIPGSASQVAALRASFDAGEDEDLRKRLPGDLDPHSVASVFKSWLRELPACLLTPELERTFDSLMLSHTGQPATSRNSLINSPPPPSSKQTSPHSPTPALLAHLGSLLATLPVENWYLLRELGASASPLLNLSWS